MTPNVNIFDSRKTLMLYSNLSNRLGEMNAEARKKFTAGLIALFDKKIVSEDGEYDTFKITEKEVKSMFNNFKSL